MLYNRWSFRELGPDGLDGQDYTTLYTVLVTSHEPPATPNKSYKLKHITTCNLLAVQSVFINSEP